jgi:hypothetical protein
MEDNKEGIISFEPKGEIYLCPVCNYNDGFHVSFLFDEDSSKWEIFLICPNCHRRFRIGWKFEALRL